jgi:glycosyltransferase involved in cell wall biosynthesis
MRAFDVCTLPSPWTPFFAYYTSPLKLFEYMVSGTPIVASDLPAFTEIITHEQSALLFPPSDSQALAAALRRLRDDPALGGQLAARARQDANQYTWRARAETLLAFAEEGVA